MIKITYELTNTGTENRQGVKYYLFDYVFYLSIFGVEFYLFKINSQDIYLTDHIETKVKVATKHGN